MNVTPYLGREFSWREGYTCADFVREVWLAETGVDLGDWKPVEMTYATMRDAFRRLEPAFVGTIVQELSEPSEPCLVLLQGGRLLPHAGIWTEGQLLHLPKLGKSCVVSLDEVMVKGRFDRVRYFA